MHRSFLPRATPSYPAAGYDRPTVLPRVRIKHTRKDGDVPVPVGRGQVRGSYPRLHGVGPHGRAVESRST